MMARITSAMFAMIVRRAQAISAGFAICAALYTTYCSFWIFRWALIAYREWRLGHRLAFVIGPELDAAICAVTLGLAVFFAAFLLLPRVRNRKRVTGTVVASVLVLSVFAMGAWASHFRDARAARDAELKLDENERFAMIPYKADLHAGMSMADVQAYLASHAKRYITGYNLHGNHTLWVKIAEEPGDGLVCDRWYVYAEMDFDSAGKLSRIHMGKVGRCL